MPLEGLNHYTIRPVDLERTKEFYEECWGCMSATGRRCPSRATGSMSATTRRCT